MDPITFVICGFVLALCAVAKHYLGKWQPGPKFDEDGHRIGYDPHYTRELEQRELGCVLTTCGKENCRTCNPVVIQPPKALPSAAKKYAVCGSCWKPVNQHSENCYREHDKRPRCHRCGEAMHSPSRDTCRACTLAILQERHRFRGPKPQTRIVEHEGETYQARIPDEVPDNAHVEITTDFMGYGTWAHWKWTDENTGKTMGLKSVANRTGQYETEQYEIFSDESVKPIKRVNLGYM